jgi:hypothetical protein
MDDFLYFLVTVGLPVTGATFILTSYIINRYKKRSFLIETAKEIPNDSRVYPFSIVTILKEAI